MPRYRDVALSCVLCGIDHTLDTAVAEAARHKDAIAALEHFGSVFLRDELGIDPIDFDLRAVLIAGMVECFDDGKVCVMQFDIFADKAMVTVFLRLRIFSTMRLHSVISGSFVLRFSSRQTTLEKLFFSNIIGASYSTGIVMFSITQSGFTLQNRAILLESSDRSAHRSAGQ